MEAQSLHRFYTKATHNKYIKTQLLHRSHTQSYRSQDENYHFFNPERQRPLTPELKKAIQLLGLVAGLLSSVPLSHWRATLFTQSQNWPVTY